MDSIREYYEQQSTEELEAILRADAAGVEELLPEVALCISDIIAKRNPPRIDACTAWRHFLEKYYPEETEPTSEA